MATKEQQARWRAKHRPQYNAYQRKLYREKHPITGSGSLAQRLAQVDNRVNRMSVRELERLA